MSMIWVIFFFNNINSLLLTVSAVKFVVQLYPHQIDISVFVSVAIWYFNFLIIYYVEVAIVGYIGNNFFLNNRHPQVLI